MRSGRDLRPTFVHLNRRDVIRKSPDADFESIFQAINDAAIAYKGIIPPDQWHEPPKRQSETSVVLKQILL